MGTQIICIHGYFFGRCDQLACEHNPSGQAWPKRWIQLQMTRASKITDKPPDKEIEGNPRHCEVCEEKLIGDPDIGELETTEKQ